VGEITQLRGVDVIERGGIQALRLTSEAGTLKTKEDRTVPIHEMRERSGRQWGCIPNPRKLG
jgi:hypothetical protein